MLVALPSAGAAPPLVQAQDGALFAWANGTLSAAPGSAFPAPCPRMAHMPAEGAGASDPTSYIRSAADAACRVVSGAAVLPAEIICDFILSRGHLAEGCSMPNEVACTA